MCPRTRTTTLAATSGERRGFSASFNHNHSAMKSDRQKRWYEKLKSDPIRYAEFQAKTRSASKLTYLANKLDPAKLERQRANRRRAAKKQWQKGKLDPSFLEYRRRYSNSRCVNLHPEYVAERLKLTVETCPPELLELKRTHLQLQRTIRNK